MKSAIGFLIAVGSSWTLVATADAQNSAPRGFEIAVLLNPADQMIRHVDDGLDEQVRRQLLSRPGGAAFEQAHPGVTAAAGAAVRNIITAGLQTRIPELHARTAALITDRLNAAEQQQLLLFLRSPAGLDLVATRASAYIGGQDPAHVRKVVAGTLTGRDIASEVAPGNSLTLRSPTYAAAINQFTRSAAGQKLAEVTPAYEQIIAEWLNAFITSQKPAIQAAVRSAIQAHLAAERKR